MLLYSLFIIRSPFLTIVYKQELFMPLNIKKTIISINGFFDKLFKRNRQYEEPKVALNEEIDESFKDAIFSLIDNNNIVQKKCKSVLKMVKELLLIFIVLYLQN